MRWLWRLRVSVASCEGHWRSKGERCHVHCDAAPGQLTQRQVTERMHQTRHCMLFLSSCGSRCRVALRSTREQLRARLAGLKAKYCEVAIEVMRLVSRVLWSHILLAQSGPAPCAHGAAAGVDKRASPAQGGVLVTMH